MDKNSAMIEYIINCPAIMDNPLFFNFGKEEDSNVQFVSKGNDKILNTPYIDGSVDKQYSFTLYIYKAITDIAIAKIDGYVDENVEDVMAVQEIIDWILEQNTARNFPDFGEKCVVDEIDVTSDNPIFNGIDDSASPAIAQYSFTVNVGYLDKTKTIWEE